MTVDTTGTAGGVVFSFIVAHFISIYCPGFSRVEWFAVTVIILITSTLGDLVESMFKRSISIKDHVQRLRMNVTQHFMKKARSYATVGLDDGGNPGCIAFFKRIWT